MKSLFNIRSLLFAFIVVVFAGCSGITEATHPDVDNSTISSTDTVVLHQEVPDYIESNDSNVPTIEPSEDRYEDRE